MHRRLTRAAVLISTIAAALAFTPVTASAALPGPEGLTGTGDCAGTLAWHKNLYYADTSTKIGELDIYVNNSTGVACAKMNHGGVSWGVTRETHVFLARCTETHQTNGCIYAATDVDDGQYAYFAGPAKVSAGAHCVHTYGWITWQQVRWQVTSPYSVLCG